MTNPQNTEEIIGSMFIQVPFVATKFQRLDGVSLLKSIHVDMRNPVVLDSMQNLIGKVEQFEQNKDGNIKMTMTIQESFINPPVAI